MFPVGGVRAEAAGAGDAPVARAAPDQPPPADAHDADGREVAGRRGVAAGKDLLLRLRLSAAAAPDAAAATHRAGPARAAEDAHGENLDTGLGKIL